MLPGDLEHQLQLVAAHHRAGGVARIRDHDRPGAVVEARLDPLTLRKAVSLLRRGGDRPHRAARQGDDGLIIGIEGLGDHDLVAVVEQAGGDDLHGLAAAVGDQDIVTLKADADPLIVAFHGVEQHVHPVRRRIGQNRLGKRAKSLEISVGRADIRLADIQMIDLHALLLRRCGCRGEDTHG